jgi:hypothetical protein
VFAAKTTDEIIDVMRADDEAAEREKILQKATPAFRTKLESIETWLRTEMGHTLRSRYELGLLVKDLYEAERKDGGKLYGRNAIGRICKVLKWDDGLIRQALQFVQTFTLEDLDRLCGVVQPTGAPLTWSHVRSVLPLRDPARRKDFLDRTVAEGWTCTELAEEIKRREDRGAADGRGRPPRMPKDFDAAVAQQQESADRWERLYTRVWSAEDRSLAAQAAKLPKDEVTEERLRQARELAHQLRQVADQAAKQAETAEQVVQDFERILADQSGSGKASRRLAAAR